MRDLTDTEIQEKYPHGYYTERKRHIKANGDLVVYECRRAKKAPRPRKQRKDTHRPAITREIQQQIKQTPLKKRARILEAVRRAIAQSESDVSDSETE